MDTSAFLQIRLSDPGALECQRDIGLLHLPVYVTVTVIAEAHRRVLFDFGQRQADAFVTEAYSGSLLLVRPSEDDETEAIRLMRKYSDLQLTFCDGLSLAVMLRLGIPRAFTYDHRHFRAVGFIVVPPLDI